MSAPGAVLGAPAPRRRRRLRLGRGEPLVWIAPAVAVVVFVFGYSMVELVKQALEHKGRWVGLENFRLTVTDPTFQTAIEHNARLLLAVPVLVVLALLLSVLLFEALRGWRFHRATMFLPYILPIPVVAVVFGQMLQLDGLVNKALRGVGLGGLAFDWLGQPGWALWTMTGVIVWKELGFGVILFLARLLSLPTETFEARAHRRRAVLPTAPVGDRAPARDSVIAFYVVVEAITMVSWVFNYVYVISNGTGGPGDATQVTELYVYQSAFQYSAPDLAAAAAVILFGATLLFIIVLLPNPAASRVPRRR